MNIEVPPVWVSAYVPDWLREEQRAFSWQQFRALRASFGLASRRKFGITGQ